MMEGAALDGNGRQKRVMVDKGDDDEGIGVLGLEAKLKRGLISSSRCGGNRTPPPVWKLEVATDEVGQFCSRSSVAEEVSARKLGANLWEIHEMIPAAVIRRRRDSGHRQTPAAVEPRRGEREAEMQKPADRPHSASSLRRHISSSNFQHHKLIERNSHPKHPESPSSYSGSMEVAVLNQSITPTTSLDLKGRCVGSQHGFKTSTELLKVLNRIWSLEEQTASNVSLVKDLKVELQSARRRIKELTQENQSNRHQIDHLVKYDRMKHALESLTDELENERRLRRHSESLHRKLGKELTEVKLSLSKAVKNLETQLRTSELLEDLCDEFAKGIKAFEHEVRELKCGKPSESKPDKMILHLSEAWLDERLQMRTNKSGNLSEKGAIIERLAGELKSFLQSRQSISRKHDLELQQGRKDDNSLRRQSLESVHLIGNTSAPRDAEDDDSIFNDLHCFELNVTPSNRHSHHLSKLHGDCGHDHQDSTKKSDISKKKKGVGEKMKSHNPVNLQERLDELTGLTTSNVNGSYLGDIVNEDQLHDESLIAKERSHSQATMRPKAEISHHLIKDAVERINEVHEGRKLISDTDHGVESHGRFPWRAHFAVTGDENDSRGFRSVSSPVRQWPNQHTKAADFEISESSSRPTGSVGKSTLKAKLLEARLEGKHARLKASKSSSYGVKD